MSLNGLDTPDVREAYHNALAEAGGWFLLRYVSRDSVELLGRGKGGVHEARHAIATYEETSPLYGLLIYRRRKVLIKFIPEGTSRLLQARTAVHFQDVLERYSPCETMLEITTSEALNDTSLAASFPLHTASPSASSSRLHEISEDGEDHGATSRRVAASHSYSAVSPMFGTQRYKTEKRVDQAMGGDRARRPTPSIQVTGDTGLSPLSLPLSSPLASQQKTSVSQFLVRDECGQRSITSIGSQPSISSVTDYAGSDVSGRSAESAATTSEPPEAAQTKSASDTPQPALVERPHDRPSTAKRLNSEKSERSVESPSLAEIPSMSESVNRKLDDEPYDFSRFDVKPKVKLGPRPVGTGESTRRQVASIAAVPANFRSVQKKPESNQQQSHASVSTAPTFAMPVFPRPPPIPDTLEYNPRPVSRGSVKSLPSHKSTTMTPDKIRLMKAVELRKKQLRKSNPQPSTLVPPKDQDAPAMPAMPDQAKTEQMDEHRSPRVNAPETPAPMDEAQPTTSKKPDSGIEMHHQDLEKREEQQSAQHEHVEEPRPSSTDEATLAQLQPPAVVEQPLQSNAEPTVSLDMLDDAPVSPETAIESPCAQKQVSPIAAEGLGITTAQISETSRLPSIMIPEAMQPTSPVVQQLQTEQAQRDEDSPSSAGDNMTGSGTPEPPNMSPRRNNSDLAKRRRGFVERLHIESHTDGDVGSDDELLEELQIATVHQAKPMTMARSPMAPSFPRRPSAQSIASDKSGPSVRSINIRRSSSNLLDKFENSSDRASPPPVPTMPSAHARSQLVVTPPYERLDPMQGLKRDVSNGITKRIQALPEVSSTETSPNGTPRPPSPEAFPPATWRERKSSVRSPPRSRTNSYKAAVRQSGRLSGWSGHQTNGLQQAETAPVWSVQHDPTTNSDSVSVTARIVRPNVTSDAGDAAPTDGQFQHPQLMINHKRTSTAQSANMNKALPPLNTDGYHPKSESTPLASPTMARGSSETRTLHSANRKSSGRHKQQAMSPMTPSAEDFPAPPIQKTNSSASVASSNDENAAASQGGSRTSRFFKRMSNFGVAGKDRRRSGAQQSASGGSNAPSTVDVARAPSLQQDRSDMPPFVVVGDLNVQFPDSLLWKRRIVEIDDAGYLIFSIPQALHHQKGSAKRFHMSEFRFPYTPDLDRQELAHSVMLDFADGQMTLQAACEDGMTHRQVLHVLKSYWKAWNSGA